MSKRLLLTDAEKLSRFQIVNRPNWYLIGDAVLARLTSTKKVEEDRDEF